VVTFFITSSLNHIRAPPRHSGTAPAAGLRLSNAAFSIFFFHHGLKGPYCSVNSLSIPPQFVGDIHQPLHDENLDVGGNDIAVTFDGTSTNLHHIVRLRSLPAFKQTQS
jgi:hypothetical protein